MYVINDTRIDLRVYPRKDCFIVRENQPSLRTEKGLVRRSHQYACPLPEWLLESTPSYQSHDVRPVVDRDARVLRRNGSLHIVGERDETGSEDRHFWLFFLQKFLRFLGNNVHSLVVIWKIQVPYSNQGAQSQFRGSRVSPGSRRACDHAISGFEKSQEGD